MIFFELRIVKFFLPIYLTIFLVVFLCAVVAAPTNRTKTIVVMLENRSFSHLFGFLTKELNGTEYNMNGPQPGARKVFLQKNPPYVLPCDAEHSLPSTTAKICSFLSSFFSLRLSLSLSLRWS